MKKCKLLIAGVICGVFVIQTSITGVYASEQNAVCYEARQNLNISAKAGSNKVNVGDKVTVTGTAAGGTAPYTSFPAYRKYAFKLIYSRAYHPRIANTFHTL